MQHRLQVIDATGEIINLHGKTDPLGLKDNLPPLICFLIDDPLLPAECLTIVKTPNENTFGVREEDIKKTLLINKYKWDKVSGTFVKLAKAKNNFKRV